MWAGGRGRGGGGGGEVGSGELFGLSPGEKQGMCSQEWGPGRGPRGLLASASLHPAESTRKIIRKTTH